MLRVFQYASDTSLWYDELAIVRNLVNRSASTLLLEPLGYSQVAPVGFMAAEKGISRILGESDLAFRALLLPIGLAAIVLFLPLAHSFARLESFIGVHRGLCTAFAESIDKLRENLPEIQPHFICSSPRMRCAP